MLVVTGDGSNSSTGRGEYNHRVEPSSTQAQGTLSWGRVCGPRSVFLAYGAASSDKGWDPASGPICWVCPWARSL